MELSNIDFSKISQPLVVRVIKTQIAKGCLLFTDLKSTTPTSSELPNYNKVVDELIIPHPIDTVFNHYISSNPATAWDGGELVKFGLGVDKTSGAIFYPGEHYPGAQIGHILYIHLNIWGLKKICMAQEITKIDKKSHSIVFSYVEGGETEGMQEIQFERISANKTRVIHTSYFKGKSKLRDALLYPYFHSLIVSKFHYNLSRSLG